ncbi:hypothetical protein BOTNAR_0007g00080 [Botryotinia narcissicola]|uniref:C2H2-type domain-containing protein n=1 Tax=Botryotinia narcissicola TaxID=278944 RepID=A0A4Z1JL49_9HELO|nr:hypothetical protein BOTNAR_0007g00080 [Botryotinia narcissicola]
MACRVCRLCGFREDQCHCQHASQDLPPEPRYITTNNIFRPDGYSNLAHEAYVSNVPYCSQSVDSNPIGNHSTHQFQNSCISYSGGYAPSTQLSCTSSGEPYDFPSLSLDPGAFANNAHSHVPSVGWMKQSHVGDEAFQSSFAKPGQSNEPEAGWQSLGNPDAQHCFHTKYPSTNYTSMKSSQAYSLSGCDLSGYVSNWEQDPSQQNNLVASVSEGVQVATEDDSRMNQPGIISRGHKPSDTSEAQYPFVVNMAQSQYSPSYSYDHSRIQEPFTVVATNQEPAALDNQNQYSPSGTISDQCQFPCKCPHEKCKRNNTKIFIESSGLQAHWYRAHKKRFLCPRCNAIFGTTAEVRRHSTAIHIDGPKEFTCDISCCAGRVKEFNRKHRLKEHMEKWHGFYSCSSVDCSRGPGHGFKEQALLKDHLLKSHGHGELR